MFMKSSRGFLSFDTFDTFGLYLGSTYVFLYLDLEVVFEGQEHKNNQPVTCVQDVWACIMRVRYRWGEQNTNVTDKKILYSQHVNLGLVCVSRLYNDTTQRVEGEMSCCSRSPLIFNCLIPKIDLLASNRCKLASRKTLTQKKQKIVVIEMTQRTS